MRFLPAIRNPAVAVKATAPAQSAIEAGWSRTPWGVGSAAADTRKLSSLMGTYGGTEDGVVWVYACTSLIQSEIASYPWEALTAGDRVLPVRSVPGDMRDVIDEPNEDMTYFDFMEYKQMDEELAGNSYWLMDQLNGLQQPLALRRLRPEYTKIAVGRRGELIGYIYEPPGISSPVPYDRDEILHFKRPHPTNPYYGMGTVEAIQRTLMAELAQTDHIIGFFSDGARISGVLTTNTLSEIQFQRFKEQFYEEYTGDANAHKILIAEQGTKFDPITQPPGGAGVVELRQMTKDEVLSGFGIPAPLLGGVLDNANHKIEDAQHILSRRMMPRARRTSETMTRHLVGRWNLKFRINATYAETKSTKIEHASGMMKGGGTVNESRAAMDLPPIAEEWANTPVIPQGFAPFGHMTSGGAPSTSPVGGNVNGNQPDDGPEDGPNINSVKRKFIADALVRIAQALAMQRKTPKSALSIDLVWDVDGIGADVPAEYLDEVRNRLMMVIEEGKRRSYSYEQIIAGFPSEQYPGVIGVFELCAEDLGTE